MLCPGLVLASPGPYVLLSPNCQCLKDFLSVFVRNLGLYSYFILGCYLFLTLCLGLISEED